MLPENPQPVKWGWWDESLLHTSVGSTWTLFHLNILSPFSILHIYTHNALLLRRLLWKCHVDGPCVESTHSGSEADLSNNSNELPLCLRQSYISPTNWATGQPLVWVWIRLIGSWLSQAFIMPNRQLTKTTVKGFKSKRNEISKWHLLDGQLRFQDAHTPLQKHLQWANTLHIYTPVTYNW